MESGSLSRPLRPATARVLATNPRSRPGPTSAWGDPAFLRQARFGPPGLPGTGSGRSSPADQDIRLAQAQSDGAGTRQYDGALLRYDSLLSMHPGFCAERSSAGPARCPGPAGSAKRRRYVPEHGGQGFQPTGCDCWVRAQVNAWAGIFRLLNGVSQTILAQKPRDVEAPVGSDMSISGRVATRRCQEDGRRAMRSRSTPPTRLLGTAPRRCEATRSRVEAAPTGATTRITTPASGRHSLSASLADGAGIFGSVNALETHDPVRTAHRVGGEAGLTLSRGSLQLSGAGGARRLYPEIAASRHRGHVPGTSYASGRSRRCDSALATPAHPSTRSLHSSSGGWTWSRWRAASTSVQLPGLSIYGGGGALWLNDGNIAPAAVRASPSKSGEVSRWACSAAP